ncbi:hypothetical protein DFH09DRAFT_1283151, partial [Mycena vulgaris]
MSLIEQENPAVAPWFFVTDLSKFVRRGFIGLLLVLAVALFWSGIYGVLALGFGRSIRPPLLHGIAVGMTGLGALILLVLATAVYSGSCLTFEDSSTKCHCLDCMLYSVAQTGTIHSVAFSYLCSCSLSPIGITIMVATRSWYDLDKDSEIH